MIMIASTTLLLSTPALAWWGSKKEVSSGQEKERVDWREDDLQGDFDRDQKRISAMNVLLPISNCAECRKVRFELSASNGCYTW